MTAAIIDYLVMAEAKPSYDAIRARLAHVLTYIATHCPTVRCAAIDEPWIGRFRAWAVHQPIVSPKGVKRQRSPSTIENSVLQLAAVINAAFTRRDTISPAAFRPIPTREVNATPQYRSDVAELAAMFRYALEPNKKRGNLLAFLRASVATWARPDAVHDISTTPARRQWFAKAGVLALNPHGRRQTRKYRATIPVARQYRPHLESANGPIIAVKSVRSAWDAMALAIGLPGQGEGGMKLIRRSVAHIARRRIGEAHWVQGSIMLGHHKTSVSDIYALPDPANIGLALAATEAIIDEIELLAPGAFYRHFTAHNSNVIPIGCGK